MKINYVEARNIITKSRIPEIDYVINPYIGCQHGCTYCYAEFMKRFTHHGGERWGEFVDIKHVDLDQINPEKYNAKTILLSSVTDPYIPLEAKCGNTRRILKKLAGTTARIIILTKSKLVTRDIDLFTQFSNIDIGVSLNTLDTPFARVIEPRASTPSDRIQAIKQIKKYNLTTYLFISPIFPQITDFRAIIERTHTFTDYYRFENLNFRPHNIPRIFQVIKTLYPHLFDHYQEIKNNPSLWDLIADEIQEYCKIKNLSCKIDFHHGGFSQKNALVE